MIIDQWNQTMQLYEIQETAVYSRTIFVAVTSECRVKNNNKKQGLSVKPALFAEVTGS